MILNARRTHTRSGRKKKERERGMKRHTRQLQLGKIQMRRRHI